MLQVTGVIVTEDTPHFIFNFTLRVLLSAKALFMVTIHYIPL